MNLTRAIYQLSELSEYAAELFDALLATTSSVVDRISSIELRVDGLREKLDAVKQDVLKAGVVQSRLVTERLEWRPPPASFTSHFTKQTEPASITSFYETLPPLPPLEILDEFRTDGQPSMKFFSYPQFFEEQWKVTIEKEEEEKRKRKEERKKEKCCFLKHEKRNKREREIKSLDVITYDSEGNVVISKPAGGPDASQAGATTSILMKLAAKRKEEDSKGGMIGPPIAQAIVNAPNEPQEISETDYNQPTSHVPTQKVDELSVPRATNDCAFGAGLNDEDVAASDVEVDAGSTDGVPFVPAIDSSVDEEDPSKSRKRANLHQELTEREPAPETLNANGLGSALKNAMTRLKKTNETTPSGSIGKYAGEQTVHAESDSLSPKGKKVGMKPRFEESGSDKRKYVQNFKEVITTSHYSSTDSSASLNEISTTEGVNGNVLGTKGRRQKMRVDEEDTQSDSSVPPIHSRVESETGSLQGGQLGSNSSELAENDHDYPTPLLGNNASDPFEVSENIPEPHFERTSSTSKILKHTKPGRGSGAPEALQKTISHPSPEVHGEGHLEDQAETCRANQVNEEPPSPASSAGERSQVLRAAMLKLKKTVKSSTEEEPSTSRNHEPLRNSNVPSTDEETVALESDQDVESSEQENAPSSGSFHESLRSGVARLKKVPAGISHAEDSLPPLPSELDNDENDGEIELVEHDENDENGVPECPVEQRDTKGADRVLPGFRSKAPPPPPLAPPAPRLPVATASNVVEMKKEVTPSPKSADRSDILADIKSGGFKLKKVEHSPSPKSKAPETPLTAAGAIAQAISRASPEGASPGSATSDVNPLLATLKKVTPQQVQKRTSTAGLGTGDVAAILMRRAKLVESDSDEASLKRDKKKKKSENPVAEESAVFVASSQQTRPESPQGDESKSKNGYVEAISKRLRNLKKKLGKLEQYDVVPKDQLNADQKLALSKRPELQATCKELEDIVKQFLLMDAEEIKAEKAARDLRDKEEQSKIEKAVHDEKHQNDNNTATLLRTIFALNRLNAPPATIQLSPEQWQTLAYFKQILTGEALDISVENFTHPAVHHLTKYLSHSPEAFMSTITYSDIHHLIELLINPPPPPAPPVFGLAEEVEVNGVQDEIPDAVPVIWSEEGVILQDEPPVQPYLEEEEELDIQGTIAVPVGGIRFGSLAEDGEESADQDLTQPVSQSEDLTLATATNGVPYQDDRGPVAVSGWSESSAALVDQDGTQQYAELAAVQDITPLPSGPPGGNNGSQQGPGFRGGFRGGPRGGFRGGFRGTAPFRGRGNGRGGGGASRGWAGPPRGRGGNTPRGQ
ncbi:Wiskott-Aldrich syndrome protein member 2 [Gonapodya sp. JEL0774]|nr:Wiskott-Aldrich syndrome protein member 2 [Gonapodya sp. JEL0774]